MSHRQSYYPPDIQTLPPPPQPETAGIHSPFSPCCNALIEVKTSNSQKNPGRLFLKCTGSNCPKDFLGWQDEYDPTKPPKEQRGDKRYNNFNNNRGNWDKKPRYDNQQPAARPLPPPPADGDEQRKLALELVQDRSRLEAMERQLQRIEDTLGGIAQAQETTLRKVTAMELVPTP